MASRGGIIRLNEPDPKATARRCNRVQDCRTDLGFKTVVGAPTRRGAQDRSAAMTSGDEDGPEEPKRCVIVVDASLPAGRAANAAAVIALTLGKRHPYLAGPDLVDRSGFAHPGLIPIGIAVLGAPASELGAIREKALARGVDVIGFPAQGQETTDYAAFGAAVAEVGTEALAYVGVGVFGPRKAVGKVVGKYALL